MGVKKLTDAFSTLIRGCIIPRGKFYIADFAQIEARYLAWSAGDERKLQMFRDGVDTYCVAASAIYGRTITKADEHERQTGKVGELALGYNGGINAYAKMGKQYDVDLGGVFEYLWRVASIEEKNKAHKAAEDYYAREPEDPIHLEAALAADIIKQRWRKANPLTVQHWRNVENAVVKAIRSGAPVSCGKSVWFTNDIWLYCRLPSGRDIAYPYPRLSEAKRKNTVTVSCMGMEKGMFVRRGYYGGKFVENETQGGCRDFTSEGIVRLEDAGYPVSFHSHDETIADVHKDLDTFDHYCGILAHPPNWSDGMPLKVEGKVMVRYGK